MCGGNSTTTQAVQIPQEVLQRYASVNDQAQQVSQRPFQQYSTDPNSFVAPLTDTQTAGIAGTNGAAGQAQPYYAQATQGLGAAQQSAQPYYDQAGGYYTGAAAMAQPYIGRANETLSDAQAAGAQYVGQSGQTLSGAQQTGAQYAGQAQQALDAARAAAEPVQSNGIYNIAGGLSAAQPYNAQAAGAYSLGLGAAQPLLTAANQNIRTAQAGAQPYQGLATAYALQGAQGVNPTALDANAIHTYETPYLQDVLGSAKAIQAQQMKQALSGSASDSIKAGAFGGDRAGIAAANVAQQLQLANNSTNAGILNSAYQQALEAAQQQQGVGLGAAQANRQAAAGAAPQLAAIGQQGYGQGLGAASALAGLGGQEAGLYGGYGGQVQGLGQQVYGQQTGTGQAQIGAGNTLFNQGLAAAQQEAALGAQQFGQGATTAQQQAALGSQLFGQGATASQQLGALGQQTFGIGSQTGQNLSGLGQLNYQTGANTSQQLAALGAGAQGASLQGAQAQLAAGQTQQQTQQAGLSALYNQFLQQQSYPFQVAQFLANIAEGTGSLSGSTTTTTQPAGFFSDERLKTDIKPIGKTFDHQPIYSFRYKGDPRTQMGLMAQDVEKRDPDAVGLAGGYKTVDYGKATEDAAKRGRFAAGGVAGFDPDLAQQLLANGSGMFGPYLSAGGGGPYGGGLGRVPSANLPVHSLMLPGAAPKPLPSLASQAKDIADTGDELEKEWGDAKGLFTKKAGAKTDDDDREPRASGGLAGGATPYGGAETGPGIDIPDDRPEIQKLQAAQSIPRQQSGISQAKDAVSTALDVAKLAAMFANRGGRVKKDVGGVVDEDIGTGVDAPEDPTKRALEVAAAAPAAMPAPKPVAQATPAGLAAALPAQTDADVPAPAAPHRSGLAKVIDRARKPDVLVPALEGLAGFLSAPTHNFGTALGAGLGSGVRGYLSQRSNAADVAEKLAEAEQARAGAAVSQARVPFVQAETETQHAQTGLTQAQANRQMQDKAPPGYVVVSGRGPKGEGFLGYDGKPYHYVLQVNATDFGATGPAAPPAASAPAANALPSAFAPSPATDAQMATQYRVDPTQPGVVNHARAMALNPELGPLDESARASFQDRIKGLQDVDNSHRQLVQLSEAINSLSRGSLSGQGHGSAYRTRLSNIYSTFAGFVGLPVPAGMAKDLTEQQIIAKIKELTGPALAKQYGEKAASVAHAISGVLPGGDITPTAANEILGQMLVATQQPRDLARYGQSYATRYGIMAGVEPSFQRDIGPVYDKDQRTLPMFMASPAFGAALSDLRSTDAKVRERAEQALDKRYGPGFHRYFTGGQ